MPEPSEADVHTAEGDCKWMEALHAAAMKHAASRVSAEQVRTGLTKILKTDWPDDTEAKHLETANLWTGMITGANS